MLIDINAIVLAQALLDKLREKNSSVGKAVSEALTVMHKHCFTLLDVSEQLAGGCGCFAPGFIHLV